MGRMSLRVDEGVSCEVLITGSEGGGAIQLCGVSWENGNVRRK